MSQWGRSAGKSEGNIDLVWFCCGLIPNFLAYIICPERKQGKEIYWAPKRLQNAGPHKYIHQFKDSELRAEFSNGSFVVIDGCDNVDALRGIKPNLVIYDEFQMHPSAFNEEVMRPNLSAKNATLVITMTPPRSRKAYSVTYREEVLEAIKAGDKEYFYFEFPSEVNPSIDREFLRKEKQRLYRLGEYGEAVWAREYLGRQVYATAGAVFPMFSRSRHIYPHDVLMSMIKRDLNRMSFWHITDPGTTSCHATLFIGFNNYTGQVFCLDEIYEKDRFETSTGKLYPRIQGSREEINSEAAWKGGYDPAAVWFANEVQDKFGEVLEPAQKRKGDKQEQVDAIKDLLLNDNLLLSDRCENLANELEEAQTDEDGDIVGGIPDHLFDDLRYGIQLEGFSVNLMARDGKPIPARMGLDGRQRKSVKDKDAWNEDIFTEHCIELKEGEEGWK